LKSLKSDPTRVLVGALVGDAVPQPNEADAMVSAACLENPDADRCQAYLALKASASPECLETMSGEECRPLVEAMRECARQCYTVASAGSPFSYVCQSGQSEEAQLGQRYLRLLSRFGGNGIHVGLCEPQGIASSLVEMADAFVRRTQRMCLPRLPAGGESLRVTLLPAAGDRTPGGREPEGKVLTEGPEPGGDYLIEDGVAECCATGTSLDSGTCPGAIYLNSEMSPGDKLRVEYLK
jgi:hypothetical protein